MMLQRCLRTTTRRNVCFSTCALKTAPDGVEERKVPVVSFDSLVKRESLTAQVQEAFGVDGMGILAVSDVPELNTLRHNLLPLAYQMANLPTKDKYTLEEAFYSFGWSHGKEKLQGKPDFSKGSFYNNPQYNRPFEQDVIDKYPAFAHPNIWPSEEIPQLEKAFMSLGQQIVDVGILVAAQCDKLMEEKVPSYEKGKLERIISSSRCCKARLLHYFAITEEDIAKQREEKDLEMEFSNWCGWHNDHGSLTGLVQALYTDPEGNVIDNPDPEAGLYVKNRMGKIVKASIPSGHLVYQIGESAQIHTGGVLQATPHAVRGPRFAGINRETLAVFMQPEMHENMSVPTGMSAENAGGSENLPIGVPPLKSRWDNSLSFDEFTQKTLNAYY